VVRGGFTLIELIFAIVVISISVMSLPMMTQTTSKGIEGNLVQEAIFAASAELNGVVTAHWDENSMEDDKNGLARMIDIDNNCSDKRLLGHIPQPFHRRCLDNSDTNPLDGTSDSDIYALEDMQHGTQNIFDTDKTNAQGYKKRYNSQVTISRPSNFNGNSNHIKEILLTVTDKDGNKITVLKTYSANIGEVDYFKRSY